MPDDQLIKPSLAEPVVPISTVIIWGSADRDDPGQTKIASPKARSFVSLNGGSAKIS
jgi:hypothetical protein